MLTGSATQEVTHNYAGAHPGVAYNSLGVTGLQVSAAGFGGYRVDVSVDLFHQALTHALRNGVNLIDTSTNYADGGSEELVGAVLQRLQGQGELSREAVVIVSKAGYLQGENYERAAQRQETGEAWPDLVPYAQGLAHCIHPDFLEDQLTRSLQRLQLETVDVYLLHNPEYYLNWAAKNGVPLDEARATYYQRIERAFRHLETEVERGRLRCYGISSNTFPAPAADPAHTSLARVWDIARSISDDHHFAVIQLPANLLETGFVTEQNQPGGESVLALARRHNLGVLINRPLNAIRGDDLLRLADVPQNGEADPQRVEETITRLVDVEQQFSREIRSTLSLPRPQLAQLADVFTVGRLLQARWRGFNSYQNWQEVQARYLVPQLQNAVQFLQSRENLPQEAREWLQAYVATTNEALNAVGAVYAADAAGQARAIREQVAALDAEWAKAPTLSQLAVRALRSTAGVSSVLVGMRREPYVDDVLAELRREVPVAPRESTWQAISDSIES
ncbi:MAG: aldo/keto reductase [Chloroflexota bacterium]